MMKTKNMTISAVVILFLLVFGAATSFAATINIISPKAGDVVGRSLNVKWQASDPVGLPLKCVSIFLSTDNGNSYRALANNIENKGDTYIGLGSQTDTTEAKIKIEIKNLNGETTTAESARFSTFTEPYAYFNPGIPSVLIGGTTQELAWTTYDYGGDLTDNPVSVYFRENGGNSWELVTENQSKEGTIIWTVPMVNTSGAYLKTLAQDKKEHKGENIYDFSIKTDPISFEITSPTSGAILFGGQQTIIRWSLKNGVGLQEYPFTLYYSIDGGATYVKIADAIYKHTENYTWNVPKVNSSNVRIKLEAVDVFGGSYQTESEKFEITTTTIPTVSITSIGSIETGGYLKGGMVSRIAWQAADLGDDLADKPITIKFSSDEGKTWQNIDENEENDGAYDWTVPNINISNTSGVISVEAKDAKGNVGSGRTSFGIDSTPPTIKITSPTKDTIKFLYSDSNWVYFNFKVSDNNPVTNPITTNAYYSEDGGSTYTKMIDNGLVSKSNYGDEERNTYYSSLYFEKGKLKDTTKAKIKIEIKDIAGNLGTAESEEFTVKSIPQINATIKDQNGGNISGNYYIKSGKYKLHWEVIDYGDNLGANPTKISSYDDKDKIWTILATNAAASGECDWVVPNYDSAQVKLKIEAQDLTQNISTWEASYSVDNVPPLITLDAPNGGEKYYWGQQAAISKAVSDNSSSAYLSCYYSTDGGKKYDLIGRYYYWEALLWDVPSIESSSVKIKIEAMDYAGNISTDESDSVFTITRAPFCKILSPTSKAVYYSSNGIDVKWEPSGEGIVPSDYSITIKYQMDDGDWQTISSQEANDGAYKWDTTNIVSYKTKLRIEAIKNGTVAASDETGGYFGIYDYANSKTLRIISPTTGESYTAGENCRIKWKKSDKSDTLSALSSTNKANKRFVTIYLWYLRGTDQNVLFITQEARQDQNYYDWEIPSYVITKQATLSVYANEYYDENILSYYSATSGIFSIVKPSTTETDTKPEPETEPKPETPPSQESGVYSNPRGKEKIVFPSGSSIKLENINFDRQSLPKPPFAGAKGIELALKISASSDKLPTTADLYLPIPKDCKNPKIFLWETAQNKWRPLSSLKLGENIIVNISELGTFALFDVEDYGKPQISAIKINGLTANQGDSIRSMPKLTFQITDDYYLDAGSITLYIDGRPAKKSEKAKTADANSTLAGQYVFSPEENLSLGLHEFKITASDGVGNEQEYITNFYVVGNSVSSLMVYPNPAKIGETVKFDGLSGNVTIYIYDISGDLVWKGFTSGAASLSWDLKNHSGNQVATGVYLYVVKDDSGGKSVGKIAIIK